MAYRKKISPVLKWRLGSKQKWECTLCGSLLGEDAEVDHRVALSAGGSNALWNLQVVHSRCHSRKSYMETVSRNAKRPLFCVYCDVYFSKYFIGGHVHAEK